MGEQQSDAGASAEAVLRVFDGWPLPLAIVSTDGRYLRVNDAACTWIGYSREEMMGRSTRDFEVADQSADVPFDDGDYTAPLPEGVIA